MTPRIYLPPEDQRETSVTLDPEQSQYLCQALRLRVGAALLVFDGGGRRRRARLVSADRKSAKIELLESEPGLPVGSLALTLVQGVATGDRMDWIIEKAVEIGVRTIVPVMCERGGVKLSEDRARKRHLHWQRIAVAACRQSGRDDLPALHPVQALPAWLRQRALPATGTDLSFMMAPGAVASLASLLAASAAPAASDQPPGDADNTTAVTILVGPESGLNQAETDAAIAAGFTPAGLGQRVLRTETAGLVAATVAQVVLGDLH